MLSGDLVDDGDRGLAQDGDRRDDDLILSGILLQGKKGLILPCQENIPLSVLHKRGRGAPGTGVEYDDISVQLPDGFQDLLLALPLLFKVVPGGQVIPHRAARGLGVGGDHTDVVPDQVIPVVDLFGVAAPHQEDDRRGVGRTVQRIFRDKTIVDQACVRNHLYISLKRQGHNIRLQTVGDLQRLFPGAAVGLGHFDLLPCQLLVMVLKDLVVGRIELAGGIVGYIGQLDHFPLRAILFRLRPGAASRRTGRPGTGPGRAAAGRKRPGRHHGRDQHSCGSFCCRCHSLSSSPKAVSRIFCFFRFPYNSIMILHHFFPFSLSILKIPS